MNKNSHNVSAYFARLAADGIKQLNVLAHTDDHAAIKAFARDLRAKREGYRSITEDELNGRLARQVRAWGKVPDVFTNDELPEELQ